MTQFITTNEINEAAAYVHRRTRFQPTVGLVLGSGLNSLADSIENADIIPTHDIPHWPASTVPGHVGRLILGQLEGQPVLVLQGRTHFYEGYPMDRVTLPIRVMAALGVGTLIVTNAAGGLNPSFEAGDLMLIRDHLNFPGLAGNNPLRGPNDETLGPRFPDMTTAYDEKLRRLARRVGRDNGVELHEGVYAYVGGPSFETPAELRLLQLVGGDAVGMSTAPEVVVARHAGIRVLGISTISNMALPDPPPGITQNHEEVLEMGLRAVPRLMAVVRGVLGRLGEAA